MTWTLSRREACFAGAGFLLVGADPGLPSAASAATPNATPTNIDADYLALRGAIAGRQAMLRAAGTVFMERDDAAPEAAWALQENTLVTWQAGEAGAVIERREGRLTLRPVAGWGPRTDIEIATGPVTEALIFDSERIVMAASGRRRALIMATPAMPRDAAWQIADQPDDIQLPVGVSALRVFSQAATGPSMVAWTMRSPWLAQLGPEPQGARLIWRAQGSLSQWEMPRATGVLS
ncbi:MAG: hypothetical protein SFV19_08980 [Rhodospirillaceae bacterium]|nr:hypothetical protein [Rhodospirillaceae bacterium]